MFGGLETKWSIHSNFAGQFQLEQLRRLDPSMGSPTHWVAPFQWVCVPPLLTLQRSGDKACKEQFYCFLRFWIQPWTTISIIFNGYYHTWISKLWLWIFWAFVPQRNTSVKNRGARNWSLLLDMGRSCIWNLPSPYWELGSKNYQTDYYSIQKNWTGDS